MLRYMLVIVMKQLLIVIDLQEGWRHTTTEPAMLRAVELCKAFQGDIIHCCFRNDPDSLFHTQLGWQRFTGPPDTDQIAEVIPLNLPIYWRSAYSRIDEQTLPIIRAADEVFIAGVFTDVSVAATAMGIFDLGVPVSVVKDCVASLHGEHVHEAALHSLDFALGRRHLIDSKELI